MKPSYVECGFATWLNRDDFEPANKSFGILSFSEATCSKLGMYPYHLEYSKGHKIQHQYLAENQQTLIAVLPVHTSEEKALYRLMIKNTTGKFLGKRQPNWIKLASNWQRQADRKPTFYKVSIYLSQ
jgi:hypothetical protein